MRHRRKLAGIILAALGLMIILSMLVPTGFWWFVLGAALIAVGICMMKH